MSDGCLKSHAGVRSAIAKEIDQRNLHSGFARHTAGRDQHERFVHCGSVRPGIEDDLGDRNDIAWQSAAANRILRYELQQRWIAKVVAAFKDDVPMHQIWMLLQVGTEACCVACIEKIDGATKYPIFNALMVGQLQVVSARRLFDVRL